MSKIEPFKTKTQIKPKPRKQSRKRIAKSDTCYSEFTHKGTWCVGKSRMGQVVTMKCPKCGMVIPLSKDYEVESSGDVNPVVKCLSCSFQKSITLNDWEQPKGLW